MRSFITLALIVGVIALGWLVAGPSIDALDPDSMMRLAFLGVLAAFVGGTFFTGGWRTVGADLRALAFWVGALIIVAGLYGFRHDLRAAGIKLAGAIIPGFAVEAGNDLVVTRGRNGMFVINGEVNGAQVRFLFDTGASGISLTADDARRAGITPGPDEFTLPTSTANGIAHVAPVRLGRIGVGPITLSDLRATVSKPGALGTSLLGHGFLDRLGSYEVRGDQLILRPR